MLQKKVADLFTMDYPFESLVERIRKDRLRLNPEFQRKYKWDKDGYERCSKFIESCLMRIPLPACYLAENVDGQTGEDVLDVIDGVQRLTTIFKFFNDGFALQDLSVFKELNGKRFSELGKYKSELETTTIRCVVLRKTNPVGIVQEIFARLNKGAVELSAQEIRHALYPGAFDLLLQKLASRSEISTFKTAKTRPPANGVNESREAEELVLRYFAFKKNLSDYEDNASRWMDRVMAEMSALGDDEILRLEGEFTRALNNCVTVFGSEVFCNLANIRKKQAFSIYDVQMNCLSDIPSEVVVQRKQDIYECFSELCKQRSFQATLDVRLSSRNKIQTRRNLFVDALASLGI